MGRSARNPRRTSRDLPGKTDPANRSKFELVYVSAHLVDAPEHHEYARAMGLLTWGTWDTESPRPAKERIREFLSAYPPFEPSRFQGSMLAQKADGEYGPAPETHRRERFIAKDSSFGTMEEALARFGLKLQGGPDYIRRGVEVAAFREVTRVRNQRLRELHGRVDVEAPSMDEAKVAEIERLEKRQAAEQIRQARARMRDDSSE